MTAVPSCHISLRWESETSMWPQGVVVRSHNNSSEEGEENRPDEHSSNSDGPDLYLWHLFLIVFVGSLFMYATTRFVCSCSLSNHRRRGPLLRWHPPRTVETGETIEDAHLRPWQGNLGVDALVRRHREPNVIMLPDSHDRDDEMCAICLDNTASGAVALPCGHHFHANCIWKWIRVSARCPLCSISVYTDDETSGPIDTASGADQGMPSSQGRRTLHMRRGDLESTRVETGSADDRSESTHSSTLTNTTTWNALGGPQNVQMRIRADSDSDGVGFTTFFVSAGVDDSASMMVAQDGSQRDESEQSSWVAMQGSESSHSDMTPGDLPGHISARALYQEDHLLGTQVAGAGPTTAPAGVQDTSIIPGPAGRRHPHRAATVARELHVVRGDHETHEIAPLTSWSGGTVRILENRQSTPDLEQGQGTLVRSTSSEEIQQLLLRAQRLLDSIPRIESFLP